MNNNVIMFTPRYKIAYITKKAPEYIKGTYKNFLKNLNIEPIESNIDYEDWIESVIPLITLLNSDFKKENIYINAKEFQGYLIKNEKTEELNIISIGLFVKREEIKNILNKNKLNIIFPDENTDYTGENYFNLKTFQENCNRVIHGICAVYDPYKKEYYEYLKEFKNDTLDKDSETYKRIKENLEYNEISRNMTIKDIEEKLKELENYKENSFANKLSKLTEEQPEENKKYFLKTIQKFIATPLKLKKNSTVGNCISEVLNRIDYSYEKLEGSYLGYTVFLQDYAEIQNEYRMFVIDNEIVCGAGCVEIHTPLNNEDKFDFKIEEKRNRTNIERDEETVNKLIEFSKIVVEKIRKEDNKYKNYILDVGIINGKPGIIEINPYQNVGLYALDYNYVLKKLISLFK